MKHLALALALLLPAPLLHSQASDIPSAAPALFSIHVRAPDGKEFAHYSATKSSPDGALTYTIPFALNDPSGAWEITVRDLAQGSEASAKVEIKSGP